MMDRRGFVKGLAAALAAVGLGRPLPLEPDATPSPVPWPPSPITDEQLADAGGFLVLDEFAENFARQLARHRRYELHLLINGTGRGEPRGFLTSRGRHA